MISSVVVLPAPFGPRMPKNSPAPDREGDAVDGDQVAVALPEPDDLDRRLPRDGAHGVDNSGPDDGGGRPTAGPGRRRSSEQISSSVDAARLTTTASSLLPVGDPAPAGSVERRSWPAPGAVSWACTACRSSRSAARAIVCQRSSRGRRGSVPPARPAPAARRARSAPGRPRAGRCRRAWRSRRCSSACVRRRQHRDPDREVLGHPLLTSASRRCSNASQLAAARAARAAPR